MVFLSGGEVGLGYEYLSASVPSQPTDLATARSPST